MAAKRYSSAAMPVTMVPLDAGVIAPPVPPSLSDTSAVTQRDLSGRLYDRDVEPGMPQAD